MDKDNWWDDLKRVVRETRENMNKIDIRSGKDSFFNDKGRIDDFQNSETLRKLREYERDLREMLLKSTEQNVVSLNQPITPRVLRKNDYENEFFDYIFKHLSQGVNERNVMTGLLADIKDDLKSIIKFNKNEKRRLNDLETEDFIKSQESRLMKESKNIGNDNASDVEAIVDSLKMIAKKLENVETQNEDMMRRLDKICENLGDQNRSGNQRALMDEFQGIAKKLNILTDKSNFAHHSSEKESKEVRPVHPAPAKVEHHLRNDHRIRTSSSLEAWNLPWEFKTSRRLLWEYEENKRQLKLLEEEGFRSPDFLRGGYHGRLSPFLSSGSEVGGHTRAKSKRTRFSDREYSTDADLTIEDLS